jgi:DNA polymerase
MTLPYNENTLREMELWPIVALQRRAAAAGTDSTRMAVAPVPEAAVTQAAIPRAERAPAGIKVRQAPAAPAAGVARPDLQPNPQPDPQRIARIATLDWAGLVAEAGACTACGLCKQRKQAVVGVGAENAPWLLVGEGPGADEDQQGEPFVGQAGKLLDAMLAAAGLKRGREVYIANVVKCRPPGNRTPSSEEAAACAPFLDRQIDLIQPKLIVALGKTAVTRLTGSEASMASLRGQTHAYRNIPVIATYHPAYLLRNLPEKLKAWEDLKLAMKVMASQWPANG